MSILSEDPRVLAEDFPDIQAVVDAYEALRLAITKGRRDPSSEAVRECLRQLDDELDDAWFDASMVWLHNVTQDAFRITPTARICEPDGRITTVARDTGHATNPRE